MGNMNPMILAGIIKNFYTEFDMMSFSNRLRIQKLIYLMKCKGINFGYSFGLYLYGPYCTDLTNDAYQMVELSDFRDINKIAPEREETKTIFMEFLDKIGDKKDDDEWLEIVASYLFLKRNTTKNDEQIIATIKDKREDFDVDEGKMREIISEIKRENYF